VPEDPFRLFDEYAVRFARGERPDVIEYLGRAGDGAEELAAAIDAFLETAPASEPDEEMIAAMSAWLTHESPLQVLRVQRGIERRDIVTALITRLGLDRAKRGKVARYYEEFEAGLLEPRKISLRVFEVLADVLHAKVADVRALPRPIPQVVVVGYDRLPGSRVRSKSALTMAEPGSKDWDEVDELFRGR